MTIWPQIIQKLNGPRAMRAITTPMLGRLVREVRPQASASTVARAAGRLEEAGILWKVAHGIWVNRHSTPPTGPEEAVELLRNGAVISLVTVLGDAGVYNNWTTDVQCVLPYVKGLPNPSTRPVEMDTPEGKRYVTFRIMPVTKIYAGGRDLVLEENTFYPRATPEAALCHWLYLANSPRSTMTAPRAHDIDFTSLSIPKLRKIANAMGVVDLVEYFLDRKQWHHEQYSEDLGF